jgi:hypothetical protein
MWNTRNDKGKSELKLIDWEMVGVGSGPQDLGQFVISNMDPADRRSNEKSLVRAYFDELIRSGVEGDENLWDFCWTEYQVGGVERWLWFLVWFLGQEGLLDWGKGQLGVASNASLLLFVYGMVSFSLTYLLSVRQPNFFITSLLPSWQTTI